MKKTVVQKRLKSEIAYDYIRKKIVLNEFQPNKPIDLEVLSAELSMSKTPIREAIKRLEANKFVEVNPSIGVVTKKLDLNELEQYVLIRRELESLATELAALNMTGSTLKKLRKYLSEMEILTENNNPDDYTIINEKFHLTIYKASNSPILYNLIKDLWDKSERTKLVFSFFPERFKQSNMEHKELLETFENADAKKAREIMYIQKTKGFLSVIKKLKEIEELRI